MRYEHWKKRYALFQDEPVSAPENAFLFLGDSITEEFPLNKFFPGWPTVNRGIKGDHIDGVIERIDISAIKLKPRCLFLMIGINDIGDRRSNAYMKNQYEKLFSLLLSELKKTQIFIQSLLPVGIERGLNALKQVKEINSYLFAYSHAHNLNFIELFNKYTGTNGFLDPKFSEDGLHLNQDGYGIWAQILLNIIHTDNK